MKAKMIEMKQHFLNNLNVDTNEKIIDNVLNYANLTRDGKVYRWVKNEIIINEGEQTFIKGVPSPTAKIEDLYDLTIEKCLLTSLGKKIFKNLELPDNNSDIEFLSNIGVEALFTVPSIESKYDGKSGLNVSNIITTDYKGDDYDTLISISIQDLLGIEGTRIYKDIGSFFAAVGINHKPIFFLLPNPETKVKCKIMYMEIPLNQK